jgi:hypothetical protein
VEAAIPAHRRRLAVILYFVVSVACGAAIMGVILAVRRLP